MRLRALHIFGLALNVIGAGIIFMFAYPPDDEGRRMRYVRLSRLAILLVFCGFFSSSSQQPTTVAELAVGNPVAIANRLAQPDKN